MGGSVSDIQRANRIALEARTSNQREYLRSLQTDQQTFVFGPAGTGKTFMATSEAMQQILRGRRERFIVIRPAVAVDEEDHGYLPGSLEEKLAPWAAPAMDVVRTYLSRDRYRQMIQNGDIAFVPFTHIRGRTFDDAFVLLDEAQNTTTSQMRAFLTRIGENTKVVVNGDLDQSDIGSDNGLTMATRVIFDQDLDVDVVHLDMSDVVRSAQCRMWVEAFGRDSDGSRPSRRPRLVDGT